MVRGVCYTQNLRGYRKFDWLSSTSSKTDKHYSRKDTELHRGTSRTTCEIGKENLIDKFSSVWYKMDAAVDRLEVKIIQASGLKLVESGPPSSYAEVRILVPTRLYFSSKEYYWKTSLPTDFGVLSELYRSTFTDWPKNERKGHIK